MAVLHISPEAMTDLQAINDYISIEFDSPAAAQNVVSKIVKAIKNLGQFPEIGTPLTFIVDIQTDYRYLVSGSYMTFYRYDDDTVYVLRVLYGKRDYLGILFAEVNRI